MSFSMFSHFYLVYGVSLLPIRQGRAIRALNCIAISSGIYCDDDIGGRINIEPCAGVFGYR